MILNLVAARQAHCPDKTEVGYGILPSDHGLVAEWHMRFPQKECQCGFESRLGHMEYTVSEPPEGYTWSATDVDDPMWGQPGKTLTLILYKNGKEVERRGVFVPEKRANQAQTFLEGMENSIRMGLK